MIRWLRMVRPPRVYMAAEQFTIQRCTVRLERERPPAGDLTDPAEELAALLRGRWPDNADARRIVTYGTVGDVQTALGVLVVLAVNSDTEHAFGQEDRFESTDLHVEIRTRSTSVDVARGRTALDVVRRIVAAATPGAVA